MPALGIFSSETDKNPLLPAGPALEDWRDQEPMHLLFHVTPHNGMNKQEWRYSIAHGLSKQSGFPSFASPVTFEVEIKDLFEFAHLQAGGVKIEEIEQLLAGAKRG